MEGKKYKIGSFNLHNLGISAFTNSRDLEGIAEMIRNENFDVVALQEILSEGKTFTKDDLPSSITKKSILGYLGEDWSFEWAYAKGDDPRHEGYGFVWNNKRLRLPTTEFLRSGSSVKRTYYPRMLSINNEQMARKPYLGRFTAQGIPGGSNFELRLICVHTYFGQKDDALDREKRQNELDVLLKDIYPQVAEKDKYRDGINAYTILLGDYNAELCTNETKKIMVERELGQLAKAGKDISKLSPEDALKRRNREVFSMKTDEQGIVYSNRYNHMPVKTVQYGLTTLKKKIVGESEEFDARGYASNYDHFSYNEQQFEDIKIKYYRIDAVQKYKADDYKAYFDTVSDHVPIALEITF